MKKLNYIILPIILLMMIFLLSGCTVESNANDNYSKMKRITVINTRTNGKVVEITGNCIEKHRYSTYNQLNLQFEYGDGITKEHEIYLNDDLTYIEEDLTGEYESNFYEVKYFSDVADTNVGSIENKGDD